MTPFIQSSLDPGNCWQTAVACILDVEPDELPSQVDAETERRDDQGKKIWRSYNNELNAYLRDHHSLMYSEIQDYQFGCLQVRSPGWHLLVGPTVRTVPETNIHHVTVARYGVEMFDVHPSKAGLTAVHKWGLLAPFPERLRKDEYWRRNVACVCPACLAKKLA